MATPPSKKTLAYHRRRLLVAAQKKVGGVLVNGTRHSLPYIKIDGDIFLSYRTLRASNGGSALIPSVRKGNITVSRFGDIASMLAEVRSF